MTPPSFVSSFAVLASMSAMPGGMRCVAVIGGRRQRGDRGGGVRRAGWEEAGESKDEVCIVYVLCSGLYKRI